MRLLLDTCVWGGTARELERLGHDVDWVGTGRTILETKRS